MKLPIRFYLISGMVAVLAGFSLLATGCATGPTGETGQTSAANRILEAYQIGDLLTQSAPAVTSSLARNLPDSVTPADRQRLDQAVNQAYDAGRLRGHVIERLKRRADRSGHKADLAKAADVLEKPLVQRMINLQTKVTDPNFAQGFKAFANQPADAARKKRLRIVDRINTAMQVTALQTGFNMTLLESMLRARNAAAPPDQRVDANRMQKILSNTQEGIHTKLEQQVPEMLLYVYRGVDTATLERYAELQQQPAMRWTNKALEQAIIQTLTDASQSIPKTYATKD